MNPKTFLQNKEKKNTQIQKKFASLDTLSDKFQRIAIKFATLYLFYLFLSCFFCIKFLFKKSFCLYYLFEPVSELESCGTYCLNLLFENTI